MSNVVNLQGSLFLTLGFQVPPGSKKQIAGYLNMMEEKESSRFVVQGGLTPDGAPLYLDYVRGNKTAFGSARQSLISAARTLKNFTADELREVKFTIYSLD